jgi:RND superfamily putative drug exporter
MIQMLSSSLGGATYKDGLGLASAVFLDAFIVRTMLVPAIMHRLGEANWWFPRRLDKITPRISIEPPDEPTAAEAGYGVSELSMPR